MDYSHESDVLQNKTMSNAESLSQENTSEEQQSNISQFVDNRPSAISERLSSSLAKNSVQSQQAAQLSKIANNQTVQKMGINEEEEESLQMKKNSQIVQRMGINEEEEEESLQMKKSTAQLKPNGEKKSVDEVSGGRKSSLPENLQQNLQNEMGHDLSDVNVHYNSQKPSQLGAHAYAQGNDIHLGAGQEKHLAHEAVHVVQQRQGRVKPTTSVNNTSVNDSPSLEQEADTIGAKINSGKTSSSPAQLKGKSTAKKGAPAQLNKDGDKATVKSEEEAEKPHEPEHALEKDKFSEAQGKQIKTAINDAYSMAVTALNSVSYDNKYYKKWCDNSSGVWKGIGKPFRKASVKKCFSKIVKTLEKEKITFKEYELDDGEKDITYAYVYNNKLRNIYLGGAFWNAPANGQDSKSGTIIHELTHKLHGTKDHTYSEDKMREYAISKPGKAVTNANNLEYFAERVD